MTNTHEDEETPQLSPEALVQEHLNGRARYILERFPKIPKTGATLRDVAQLTRADLKRAKNCGDVTINHIQAVLLQAGLKLAVPPGETPEAPIRPSADAWVVSSLEAVPGGVQVTLRAPGTVATATTGVLKLRRTVEESRALYVSQQVRLMLEPIEGP